MKSILTLITGILLSQFLLAMDNQLIWVMDNLINICGNTVVAYGKPVVIDTEFGKAIEFNTGAITAPGTGTGDRIQIKGNPLGTSPGEFTIEMIFKPYATSTDFAPRILHICRPDSMSGPRVMTMEIRSTNNWSTDFYIKSVTGTGILGTKKYPVDTWMHMAMTYKNGVLKGFVNGEQDVVCNGSAYTGMPVTAEVSLGGRMNHVNYFKGAIRKLIFTSTALEPEQFTLNDITGTENVTSQDAVNLRNFPNPVSDYTNISFKLLHAEYYTIEIFNNTGKKIRRIEDSTQQNIEHSIIFERKNLPAGIYFYRLITPSGINITGKMNVL